MEDNSFDKKIRSVLEGYEDTTPSGLGWDRFQGTYGQTVGITGIKKWLKLSVVANVLLVGTVAWLLWNVDQLQDRITTIEEKSSHVASEKNQGDEESAIITGDVQPEKPKAQQNEKKAESHTSAAMESDQLNAGSKNITPRNKALAFIPVSDDRTGLNELAAFRSYQKVRLSDNGVISGVQPVTTHLVFVKVYGESTQEDEKATATKEPNLPIETVIALEKNKMGNHIGWSFGLSSALGMANFGQGYQGLGIQNGLAIGALIHPMWGIESGISLDQYIVSSSNAIAASTAWQNKTGSTAIDPIDRVNINFRTLELPLLVRFRLPVSDRKSWFASAGVVQSFILSEKQTFFIQQLEDHEEYESHYELTKREFSSEGINPFYTGLIGEIGMSKQIKDLPLRWQLSTFYKHRVGQVSRNFEKADMIGIKGSLRFSRW